MGVFVLSSKSIGVLAQAIVSANSLTEMKALFLEAEVDQWEPEQAANKLDRAMELLKNLRSENSDEANAGGRELARLMLARGKANESRYFPEEAADWWVGLRDAVAADGWEFDTGADRLVPTVSPVQVPEEMTWIEADLKQRGWTTAAGHYRQAVDAFAVGNWASANSQLRAFFEDVVCNAAAAPPGHSPGKVQRAFDALTGAGKIASGEATFGKALWALLHPGGSHPGLSDEDESRFRLFTLTGYARYLLKRI